MKVIITLFIVTLLLTSCVKTSSEHPPQAQPIIMLLEAVNTNSPAPLRSALSESQLKEYEIDSDWKDGLKAL